MHLIRSATVLACVLAASSAIRAASEPVVVELQPESSVQFAVVAVGDVARISGGDAASRERIAKLDVAEVKSREQSLIVSRRALEYRLRLAGIDAPAASISGADRTTVTVVRRTVSADEVAAAAKAEIARWLTVPKESVSIELARPIVVRLPEVPSGEFVSINAVPHVKSVGLGRAVMDVSIVANGEKLLALGVDLDVRSIVQPVEATPVAVPVPTGSAATHSPANVPMPTPKSATAVGTAPATSNPAAAIVHVRQRVSINVRMGGLNVTAVGEAQQEGRLGQVILVQNPDSKKTVSARVTGPGTVEVELEGRQQ
jgi:endonuclease YncB( thermonuclease family)